MTTAEPPSSTTAHTGTRGVHTSAHPAIGTYQEALTHLGRRSEIHTGEVPVERGAIAMYCAMIGDPNPAYWDTDVAQASFGGPVAPPALIQGTVQPLPWRPDGGAVQALAVFAVPLPGKTLINVSTDAVHHRPFFAGETISYHDEVVDISPERTTRLGTGHFITTVFHYCAGDGSAIADITNVMFRFGEAGR